MHGHHSHWGHRGRQIREAMREYAEAMYAGRFGPRGHGRHGRDHDGEGPEGGFGWGGGWGRGGRALGHGDLRLLLLALIGEKPSHGYDLIKAIEERFAGGYAPSPGAVYPTLQMLEEQDFIRAQASEGSKKLFAITPEGQAFLEENKAQVEGMFARIDLAAAHFTRHTAPESVHEAWKTLKQALNMRRSPWTEDEAQRIKTILEKAARDIVAKG